MWTYKILRVIKLQYEIVRVIQYEILIMLKFCSGYECDRRHMINTLYGGTCYFILYIYIYIYNKIENIYNISMFIS